MLHLSLRGACQRLANFKLNKETTFIAMSMWHSLRCLFFPLSAVSVCSSFKQRRRSTYHNKFQSRDSSSKSVMLGEDSCHRNLQSRQCAWHFPKRISIFRRPQKDKCDLHASAAALIFVSLKHYFHLGVTTSRLRCMTLTSGRGPKDTAQCRNRRRKVGRVNQLYCSLDYTDIWSGEPDTERLPTLHSKQAPSPWLTLDYDAFLTLSMPIPTEF